jgi:hypothetical protein
VYEIIRTHWDNIKTPYDILITVYDAQAGTQPYADLEETVLEVLKQAGIWQEKPKDGKAG